MAGGSLLVSDLDGTLLGYDAALGRFAQWCRARRAGMRLAYASGRLFDSIVEIIRQTQLPEPDVVVAGVGSDLRWFAGGEPLVGWRERLACRWDPHAVRAALAGFKRLRPQPSQFQTAFKVSYYAGDLPAWVLRAVRGALAREGLCAEVVYSSNRDLDILPAGAGKGSAATFLADLWQISCEQVVVSGDSGNDLTMFQQGFRGIVVANAQDELKGLAGANVFHSRFAFADGVLDGLRHWLE